MTHRLKNLKQSVLRVLPLAVLYRMSKKKIGNLLDNSKALPSGGFFFCTNGNNPNPF